MAIVILIVVPLCISVVAGIIIMELYSVMPKMTDWLLRMATRRLAGAVKDRCFEEWRAQLADIPSPLFRLIHAGSLIVRANTLLEDDIAGYFSEVDADLDKLLSLKQKNIADLKVHVKLARSGFATLRRSYRAVSLVVAAAGVRLDVSPLVKVLAFRKLSKKYAPYRRSISTLETAMAATFEILRIRQANVIRVIAKIRDEKNRAAASLAGSSDYDIQSPIVAAGLRQKLKVAVAEIDTMDEKAKKTVAALEAGMASLNREIELISEGSRKTS